MPTFLTLGMPRPDGHRPLLDGLLVTGHADGVALTDGLDAATASDTLAVLVHAGPGFVAGAADGAGVLRVLAATVAALRGDDVRAAWTAPDAARVSAVPDPAAQAMRQVLLAIVVPAVPGVEQVTAELSGLGVS